MKKAVVFGGSGFIGSHVADKLSDSGYQTIIVDAKPSPWLRNGQEMVVGNILNLEVVNKAISGAELVYNFAGLADINEALDRPLKTAEVNIVGNLNIMNSCVEHKISRFVFASTVYVNSRQGGFYRCSKQAAEAYLEEYQKSFGLDYTILRYGSLYGPRADHSNGLYRIVKDALKTGKLSYIGHPDAMREYIHVADAANASLEILNEEYKNQCIVLTGLQPIKILDLLKLLGEMLGMPEKSVEFKKGEYLGHYIRTPYAFKPNIGKKFVPNTHVDLGQGLLEIIEDLRELEQ